MNDQAIAILNGAIAQLTALSASQQASILADTADATDLQAKLDADNADIAKQTADKASTDSVSTALQQLVANISAGPGV